MGVAWSLDRLDHCWWVASPGLAATGTYALEYSEMLQYGAEKSSMVPTGEIFDAGGKTGVYRAG